MWRRDKRDSRVRLNILQTQCDEFIERKFTMFNEIKRELINTKEKLRRKQKLESLIAQTKEALQRELDKKGELHSILDSEIHDVKKLESLSIANIFYTILRSKQHQLEKERQELLSAKLKYDDCCRSISALERELEAYNTTLNSFLGAESEYSTILKLKKEFILSMNNDTSHTLLELMDNLVALGAQSKELKEAIEVGKQVQDELSRMVDSLESAEGWGTWDMLGGGLIATAAKHSRIDEANEYANNVKIALIRFQNELSDVNISMDIDINIDSFEKFADFFFDGLISDWIVQSKIGESLDSVNQVVNQVNCVMASLKSSLRKAEGDLTCLENKINILVEQA